MERVGKWNQRVEEWRMWNMFYLNQKASRASPFDPWNLMTFMLSLRTNLWYDAAHNATKLHEKCDKKEHRILCLNIRSLFLSSANVL